MPRFALLPLAAAVVLTALRPDPIGARAAPFDPTLATRLHRTDPLLRARAAAPLRASRAGANGRALFGPHAANSVPDGGGGTYVVWATDYDGGFDIYLQRVTATGDVASGWPAGGLAVCTAPGPQIEPGILSDGANGVLVGWPDFRDHPFNGLTGTVDLYAQRVSAAGVPQWAANGVLALSDFNFFDDLSVVADGTGGACFVWSVGIPGDIRANRVSGAGVVPPGWNTTGVLVCGDAGDQFGPVVESDGSGGFYIAWEDARALGHEVYAQHLNASGMAQWAANGISLTNGATGHEPAVCSDGGGGMIASWLTGSSVVGQRFGATGAAQWTAGGVSMGATGAYAQGIWSWPVAGGGACVCWHDGAGSAAIIAQRVNGSGVRQWTSTGILVSAGSGERFVADGFVDVGGGLSLLWEDTRSGASSDLYVARLDAAGTPQWAANGVALVVAPEFQRPVSLAPDGAGGLVATWVDYRTQDAEPYAQRVSASGVVELGATGKVVAADPGVQRAAFVAPDGFGGTWTAWHEKVGGDYQIRARRMAADGTPLTGSITVCGAPGWQVLGGVLPDGAGGIVLGWRDRRSGTETDVYAQRLNGSGVPQWIADGVPVCIAPGDQDQLCLVGGTAGSAIFGWADYRSGFEGDIYAQRLSGSGVALWSADGIGVCTQGSAQWTPALAPSGMDGAIIAWADSRYGTPPFLAAQRLNGAGAAQWTDGGVPIATLDGVYDRCAGAVSDLGDGAIVLVEEYVFDAGSGDFVGTELTVQRVNAAGAAQWGPSGTEVASASAYRDDSRLVADGVGGAIAGWSDPHSGVNDIHAQRINGSGALQWGGASALAVCDAPSWQTLCGIAPDGAGGAVFAWSDERSGVSDVYAQYVNGAGAAMWAANGVAVASAARGQYEAAPCAAGGSTVLVWTDFRNAAERLLYAQKLSASGVAQWAADGVTAALVSLVAAEAGEGRVRVTWWVSGASRVTAFRRVEGGSWELLGVLPVDGEQRATLADASVVPGGRYAYRIAVPSGGGVVYSDEVWIELPLALALGIDAVRPQPTRGEAWVWFTLPAASAARIEVLDVAGRRVLTHDLGRPGAGRHAVRLPELPGGPGVRFVRLWQDGRSATARVLCVAM